MNKEEFLKLSDLDKVKYSIEESLKEHKGYEREYFKGSAAMGKSILQTIEQVKEFAITDVSQQRELLIDFMNKTQGKLIWGWDIGGGEKLADEYLKGNL
jgi:hypothetical protein